MDIVVEFANLAWKELIIFAVSISVEDTITLAYCQFGIDNDSSKF